MAPIQLVLANPGSEVMKKLDKTEFIQNIGQEWIYLTVGEAVGACNFMLHTCKRTPPTLSMPPAVELTAQDNV